MNPPPRENPPFRDPDPTPSGRRVYHDDPSVVEGHATIQPYPQRQETPPPLRPRALALPSHRVILTPLLLGINIVVFLILSYLSRGGFMDSVLGGADGYTLVMLGAKENTLILSGEYWRLLTPVFLHIGIVHLLLNSYALNIFGREVEGLFGSVRFAVIYLLAGIAGTLLSFAFSPSVAAGASGAIFGVIGAMAAFLIQNRQTLGEQGKKHLQSLAGMIGINLVLGFTLAGIDNYGHMGGLISGFILGYLLSPIYTIERTFEPPDYHRVVERPPRIPTAAIAVASIIILGVLLWVALPIAPI